MGATCAKPTTDEEAASKYGATDVADYRYVEEDVEENELVAATCPQLPPPQEEQLASSASRDDSSSSSIEHSHGGINGGGDVKNETKKNYRQQDRGRSREPSSLSSSSGRGSSISASPPFSRLNSPESPRGGVRGVLKLRNEPDQHHNWRRSNKGEHSTSTASGATGTDASETSFNTNSSMELPPVLGKESSLDPPRYRTGQHGGGGGGGGASDKPPIGTSSVRRRSGVEILGVGESEALGHTPTKAVVPEFGGQSGVSELSQHHRQSSTGTLGTTRRYSVVSDVSAGNTSSNTTRSQVNTTACGSTTSNNAAPLFIASTTAAVEQANAPMIAVVDGIVDQRGPDEREGDGTLSVLEQQPVPEHQAIDAEVGPVKQELASQAGAAVIPLPPALQQNGEDSVSSGQSPPPALRLSSASATTTTETVSLAAHSVSSPSASPNTALPPRHGGTRRTSTTSPSRDMSRDVGAHLGTHSVSGGGGVSHGNNSSITSSSVSYMNESTFFHHSTATGVGHPRRSSREGSVSVSSSSPQTPSLGVFGGGGGSRGKGSHGGHHTTDTVHLLPPHLQIAADAREQEMLSFATSGGGGGGGGPSSLMPISSIQSPPSLHLAHSQRSSIDVSAGVSTGTAAFVFQQHQSRDQQVGSDESHDIGSDDSLMTEKLLGGGDEVEPATSSSSPKARAGKDRKPSKSNKNSRPSGLRQERAVRITMHSPTGLAIPSSSKDLMLAGLVMSADAPSTLSKKHSVYQEGGLVEVVMVPDIGGDEPHSSSANDESTHSALHFLSHSAVEEVIAKHQEEQRQKAAEQGRLKKERLDELLKLEQAAKAENRGGDLTIDIEALHSQERPNNQISDFPDIQHMQHKKQQCQQSGGYVRQSHSHQPSATHSPMLSARSHLSSSMGTPDLSRQPSERKDATKRLRGELAESSQQQLLSYKHNTTPSESLFLDAASSSQVLQGMLEKELGGSFGGANLGTPQGRGGGVNSEGVAGIPVGGTRTGATRRRASKRSGKQNANSNSENRDSPLSTLQSGEFHRTTNNTANPPPTSLEVTPSQKYLSASNAGTPSHGGGQHYYGPLNDQSSRRESVASEHESGQCLSGTGTYSLNEDCRITPLQAKSPSRKSIASTASLQSKVSSSKTLSTPSAAGQSQANNNNNAIDISPSGGVSVHLPPSSNRQSFSVGGEPGTGALPSQQQFYHQQQLHLRNRVGSISFVSHEGRSMFESECFEEEDQRERFDVASEAPSRSRSMVVDNNVAADAEKHNNSDGDEQPSSSPLPMNSRCRALSLRSPSNTASPVEEEEEVSIMEQPPPPSEVEDDVDEAYGGDGSGQPPESQDNGVGDNDATSAAASSGVVVEPQTVGNVNAGAMHQLPALQDDVPRRVSASYEETVILSTTTTDGGMPILHPVDSLTTSQVAQSGGIEGAITLSSPPEAGQTAQLIANFQAQLLRRASGVQQLQQLQQGPIQVPPQGPGDYPFHANQNANMPLPLPVHYESSSLGSASPRRISSNLSTFATTTSNTATLNSTMMASASPREVPSEASRRVSAQQCPPTSGRTAAVQSQDAVQRAAFDRNNAAFTNQDVTNHRSTATSAAVAGEPVRSTPSGTLPRSSEPEVAEQAATPQQSAAAERASSSPTSSM